MAENKSGNVVACVFKRFEDSDWEVGFYISDNLIVDLDGKVPEDIHDMKYEAHNGCFWLFARD